MPQSPASNSYGLTLALAGALLLTPDALLMKLSGMSGLQMLGWRALSLAAVFWVAWVLSSRQHVRDLAQLGSGAALVVIACQVLNSALFPIGIAVAPVAPVLLGVATVPVCAALLARLLHGETTSRGTWIAISLTLLGITIAITERGATGFDTEALLGAACGLGVAFALALKFVTLRHNPGLPLLPTVGTGALCAAVLGWSATGPANMTEGTLWPMLLTSVLILPLSFLALSQATRHTAAANVSLLLLLETVLGPLWVWIGIGEAPSARMMAGGALVVVTLGLYVSHTRRRAGMASRTAVSRRSSTAEQTPGP